MLKLTSTQLKAALLCIVFASNTILGFACAVGVDMVLIKHIIHSNGTEVASESHVHVHNAGEKHHLNEKEPADEDGCCNSKVVSFEHLDK